MLAKQAKILAPNQVKAVLAYLDTTRHPDRNRLVFLLSLRAGLRAKEIAGLTWSMVTDPEGALTDAIHLRDSAAKGRTGGVIPVSKDLQRALEDHRAGSRRTAPAAHIIQTERAQRTSSQMIINTMRGWYRALGFDGCSSHSGRRTFITNAARNIGRVGGSLRDVQALARHASLATTQRYIEISADAMRKVVDL